LRCYWLSVFPQLRRELSYWRAQAARIPDSRLRRLALLTHDCKWFNTEGAAAFAILAPAHNRRTAITALVAFQAAYDYADTVAEQPADDPAANGLLLHQSLIAALRRDLEPPNYYSHSRLTDDGGYLQALIDTCRSAFHKLPRHCLVNAAVTRASKRITAYQSLNHGGADARRQLTCWAERETPRGSGLRWWETAAACASSLTALALMSAAADPNVTRAQIAALERAYHPWIGALHTLLDSLIDWGEDERTGQPSLLDSYASSDELAERMRTLAARSRAATATLVHSALHTTLLAGMVSVYLATSEAQMARTGPIAEAVLQATGSLTVPSLAVLRLRHAVHRGEAPLTADS
jgi:tetraprenyl-beta-curcumene synthase